MNNERPTYPWNLEHRIAAWNLLNVVAQKCHRKYCDYKKCNPYLVKQIFSLSPLVTTAFEYLGKFWDAKPPPEFLKVKQSSSLFHMTLISFWATCKLERILLPDFNLKSILTIFVESLNSIQPTDKIIEIFQIRNFQKVLTACREQRYNDNLVSEYISFILKSEICFYTISEIYAYHSYPFAFFNDWIRKLRLFYETDNPFGDLQAFRQSRDRLIPHLICIALVASEKNINDHQALTAAAFREAFSKIPQTGLSDKWEDLLKIQFDSEQNHTIKEIQNSFPEFEHKCQSIVFTY